MCKNVKVDFAVDILTFLRFEYYYGDFETPILRNNRAQQRQVCRQRILYQLKSAKGC